MKEKTKELVKKLHRKSFFAFSIEMQAISLCHDIKWHLGKNYVYIKSLWKEAEMDQSR